MATRDTTTVRRPAGSDPIARWAARNGFNYQPVPDHEWFAAWEPFETMVAPPAWFNAVSGAYRSGHVTIAEPWLADEGFEPIDRTLVAFVVHPRLRGKASARVGESFLTRVAYVGSAPPPRAKVGDPRWDERATTYAPIGTEPGAVLLPGLRELLLAWRFEGHLELRPRGMILHVAGLHPNEESLDKLMRFVPLAVDKALGA
ncbi:MAG TPA: hypothetical protein PLI95_12665 [Polyangiaceae bacterium]|nr:hypothetical protein [Polyangiaceae bacterium]